MKVLRTVTALAVLLAALPLSVLAAAPTAAPFSTAVPVNAASVIQLQGADPDGTPLVYAIVGAPAHGTLSQLDTATGSLIYTPTAGYTGTDSFTYTVTSGGQTASAATVSITVTAAKTRIVDTLLNPDGTPRAGTVTFVLTQAAVSPAGLIAAKSTVSATLTASGGFDVQLYPSRAVSPQQRYQVYFADKGGGQQLLGVYDIPAATGTIILSPYRVTDVNLAIQYTFASQAGIESLRNQIGDAVLAQLLAVPRTAGRLQKWDGANLSDSIVAESVAGLAVAGNVQITDSLTVTNNLTVGGTISGSGAGLTNVPNSALPSTLTGKTLAAPTLTGTTTATGNVNVTGNAVVTGNLTVTGAINGSGAGIYGLPNSALPPVITGKTINTPVITGATTANGDINVAGNVKATGYVEGDGSRLTGISGASGGVSNVGNTAISSTNGVVTISTGGVERLRITNDGRMTGQAANIFYSVFNVKDFGAKGDGTTDDGPAFQAAYNALATLSPLRSGILYHPEGKYRITSAVDKNFLNLRNNVVLLGAGGGSRLFLDGGASLVAFRLVNLQTLLVRDLIVHGNTSTGDDVLRAFELRNISQARFEGVHVYGVAALATGGGVLWASSVNLIVQNSTFNGCAARYDGDVPANSSGIIQVENSRGLVVENVQFPDYGQLDNVFHSKTPVSPGIWINVKDTPAQTDAFLSQGSIRIRGVQGDEGASNHIRIIGTTNWFDVVSIEDVKGNIGISHGIHVEGVRNVRIADAHFNYVNAAPPNRNAIYIDNVDNAEIDRPVLRYYSSTIQTGFAVKSVKVRGGIYSALNSFAARTEEIVDGATGRVYFRPTPAGRACTTLEAIMFLDAADGKLKVCESGGPFRAVLPGGSPLSLLDDFNDNGRDPAKWDLLSPAGFTVAETGGQLSVTPPASTAPPAEGGYLTANAYDFAADGKASVEVVGFATGEAGGPTIVTVLGLAATSGSDAYVLFFSHATGQITAASSVGGVYQQVDVVAFDATTDHWRMRYDSASNTMFWDTSADGMTWTQRHSRTAGAASLASVKARLTVQIANTGTVSAPALFDNFALTRVAN